MTVSGTHLPALGLAVLVLTVVCWITIIDWKARRADPTSGDNATVVRIRSYQRASLAVVFVSFPFVFGVLWSLSREGRDWWYLLPGALHVYSAYRMFRAVSRMRIVSAPQVTGRNIVLPAEHGATALALDAICDITEMHDQTILGRGLGRLSSFEAGPAALISLAHPVEGVWRYLAVGERVPVFVEKARDIGLAVTKAQDL